MNQRKSSEKGQAIVLLMLGLVVLFGFTAMAIDGGMVYSQRRSAQNSADAAALAGALQMVNLKDAGYEAADNAIINSVRSNGYKDAQITDKYVEGPLYDPYGYYYLVHVELTVKYDASFTQFVWGKILTNVVKAVARARPSQPVMNGYAIVTMGNCVAGDPNNLVSKGGGGSNKPGVISAFDGDIFFNTPETADNACSLDPGSSSGGGAIEAYNDPSDPGKYHVRTVGQYDYASADPTKILPLPVVTNENDGVPIGDPLQELAEPKCSANSNVAGNIIVNGQTYDVGPGRSTAQRFRTWLRKAG